MRSFQRLGLGIVSLLAVLALSAFIGISSRPAQAAPSATEADKQVAKEVDRFLASLPKDITVDKTDGSVTAIMVPIGHKDRTAILSKYQTVAKKSKEIRESMRPQPLAADLVGQDCDERASGSSPASSTTSVALAANIAGGQAAPRTMPGQYAYQNLWCQQGDWGSVQAWTAPGNGYSRAIFSDTGTGLDRTVSVGPRTCPDLAGCNWIIIARPKSYERVYQIYTYWDTGLSYYIYFCY